MDRSFVFPRPQPAVARPSRQGTAAAMAKPGQTISRESNALRASVLDAALELGIGTNPLVADWMFNNALKEEDEEEQDQVSSPSLTYGSSATSEESAFSVQTPSSTHSSSPALGGGGAGVATKFGQLRSDGIIQILDSNGIGSRKNEGVFSANGNVNGGVAKGSNTVSFPDTPPQEVPIPPRPTTPRKLKKKNKGDGYESDGGYVSEGGGKKKQKEKKKADSKEKDKGRDKEVEAGQEDERKRKKSLLSAVKSSKGKSDSKEKDKDLDASRGYETDGGASKSKSEPKKSKSKGKSPSADVVGGGYDTDAGYQSSSSVKKSKTRFFRLGGSKDKGSSASGPEGAVMQAPPVPALPADILKDAVSLPIAERFATTFGSPTSGTGESATSLSASLSDRIDSPTSATPSPPLPPSSSSGTNLSSPLGAHVAPRPGMLPSRFAASTTDRSSQASTESSNSSLGSSRRRGPFSPTPSSSAHGHGVNDSGASYSTLTSSQSHPQVRQQQILSSSRPTSPTGSAMSPSTSISISISQVQDTPAASSSNQKGSHPPVSFLLPRMPSPTPVPLPSNTNPSSSPVSPISPSAVPLPATPVPISPLQINKDHKEKEKGKGGLRLKPSLEKLGLPSFGFGSGSSSRGASPAPVSPVSPGAVGAASHPVTSSSRYGARPQAQTTPSTPSPHVLISSPNTASNSPSPPAVGSSKLQEQQQQKLTQLSLAPPDGTSSTSRSPSPSRPNVLAYYDMPPPSPPPMGPLPTLPGSTPNVAKASLSTSDSTPFPSASVLRQRMIDRSPRPVPADAVPYQQVTALQNIQRGRESPFPARPVLPPGTVPKRYGPPMTRQQQEEAVSNSKDIKRARFASGEPTQIDTDSRWMDDDESEAYYSYAEDESGEVIGYEQEEEEDEEESRELRNVLDRFADDRRRSAEDEIQALERSHSFEALKKLTGQDAPVADHVIQPPQPTYAFARPPKPKVEVDTAEQDEGYDGMTIGNRSSRWSGSIYSRNSILDEDESGQGRERLVRRVEAMLREGEKKRGLGGDGGIIPPVPKLPAAYANMNNSLNGGATGVRSSSAQDMEATSPVERSWNRF